MAETFIIIPIILTVIFYNIYYRVMMAQLAQLDHKDPPVLLERLAPLDQRVILVTRDLRYCTCVCDGMHTYVVFVCNIECNIYRENLAQLVSPVTQELKDLKERKEKEVYLE